MLTKELGTLVGQTLDLQIINGSGSAGQMAGLLVVSGTTAVTSTTVTAVANIATIGKAYDLASVAGGVVADTMVAIPGASATSPARWATRRRPTRRGSTRSSRPRRCR